jgi:hypothetical protein
LWRDQGCVVAITVKPQRVELGAQVSHGSTIALVTYQMGGISWLARLFLSPGCAWLPKSQNKFLTTSYSGGFNSSLTDRLQGAGPAPSGLSYILLQHETCRAWIRRPVIGTMLLILHYCVRSPIAELAPRSPSEVIQKCDLGYSQSMMGQAEMGGV